MWSPGEYLVIDRVQAAAGLLVFCAVLAFSRWRVVRFAADQNAATMAIVAEALTAIGRGAGQSAGRSEGLPLEGSSPTWWF
ncbi:hypothetical protein ABH37_18205 [Mycobacterium haemophilum]|uniref:Uncharacterized protein n=1 Tax=Mycobacterium haemophilum TaxID=29311 RepID=A0A0I9U9C5_9MYCO|nr:hypothetical protein ABH39_18080 [Mycobacterium haemophilum]KLO37823.1 hypothetical protein ABH38_07735 [Mycobacterium haemophilum]KLO39516.1 hypothetical protein ABH37_18205 [Mycobacterium haemophilum]KLO55644.1 hypothetical protein ABH36_06690 [Mycobacterium haemophilum]